uniref:Uncharacterized protein n=1 Tax=Ditylenchus dipsaci TaxID=166011 RepID=A0A915EPS9_9BILA
MNKSSNDRIWAQEQPDTEERAVERTQKTESVMVWGAISAGGKTPLVFVDQKTNIDRYVYNGYAQRESHSVDQQCFWRRCLEVPARRCSRTQGVRNSRLATRELPRCRHGRPSLPSSNRRMATEQSGSQPMDYSVWSILEEKAWKKPHPNVESLKKALKKA